jgi:diaminopimelate decarboxylase
MHYFTVKNGSLHCEDVPLTALAERYGTPLYVYSYWTLARHYKAYQEAFGRDRHLCCYAVKANTSGAILRALGRMGAGADVVSGGELHRSLEAGIPADRIIYAGVGKTRGEIEFALSSGILMFNVESSEEMQFIDTVAGEMGLMAPIALRVNPAVDPGTHQYIATGLKKSKFGIAHEEALEHFRLARGLKNTVIRGIHMHIGSQITDTAPFLAALEKVAELVGSLKAAGVALEYLDIGGGLGITYDPGKAEAPHPTELARELAPLIERLGLSLITEPGRSIVGNAGVLLTRVLYTKTTPANTFLIVDAGMNDLIRPSLYGSYHEIRPVVEADRPTIVADVVGPICESGDFLAKAREMPAVGQGDLLAVMSAGAYGFAMSSTYNSRPRVAEILVRDDKASVIRRRETYEDLTEGEIIPEWLP